LTLPPSSHTFDVMTNRTLLLVACLGALVATVQASQSRSTIDSVPPSPYIDKGACPFECCTYRNWTASQGIALVDQPNGKKIVARIHKGEKVQALTGEVHCIPLRVVAVQDDPDAGVKRGEVIYILHYTGEGYWKVWHNGRLVEIDNFSDKGPYPQHTWCVKVKTTSGVVGWTISHGNFSNQDACG
jgi:hypothetical protein